MKRLATVEVEYCDFCDNENGWRKCIGCGKCGCSNCSRSVMNEYGTGVYGGSHYYTCQTCDPELRKTKSNELFNALLVVHSLRLEMEGFQSSFGPRVKAAEADAERIRERDNE